MNRRSKYVVIILTALHSAGCGPELNRSESDISTLSGCMDRGTEEEKVSRRKRNRNQDQVQSHDQLACIDTLLGARDDRSLDRGREDTRSDMEEVKAEFEEVKKQLDISLKQGMDCWEKELARAVCTGV